MGDRAVQADWVDATGLVRTTRLYALTNPCTILNALQAVSNAQVLRNFDGTVDPPIGALTAGKYQGVADRVVLLFATGAGTILRLTLPAPQNTIFLADGKTVDLTSIAGLIAACVGELSDGAGNAATSCIAGVLSSSAGSDLSPIG